MITDGCSRGESNSNGIDEITSVVIGANMTEWTNMETAWGVVVGGGGGEYTAHINMR